MGILGFDITGHDNGSYAFFDRQDVRRCELCGHLTHKWEETLEGFVIQKHRDADISATYDGIQIVSGTFVELCRESKFTGVVLKRLPDDPQFWAISSDRVLAFDAEKRGTRFEDRCQLCGQYGSIVGADPIILKASSVIPDCGFARTDIEFGSGDEKSPLLLCGASAGHVLSKRGLRGLELEKIEMEQ